MGGMGTMPSMTGGAATSGASGSSDGYFQNTLGTGSFVGIQQASVNWELIALAAAAVVGLFLWKR